MDNIAGVGRATSTLPLSARPAVQKPSDVDLEVKEKFQEFVAGTFYSQMLKALHKTHDKPAYFHGGQAEELFQSQMDQQVASDLSKHHGSSFSEPLFSAFQNSR